MYTFVNPDLFLKNRTNLATSGVLCEKINESSCAPIIPTFDMLSPPIYILQEGFKDFQIEDFQIEEKDKIYATPFSRKVFPPETKKDFIIHPDMLKTA
jgi:hypothetical protein